MKKIEKIEKSIIMGIIFILLGVLAISLKKVTFTYGGYFSLVIGIIAILYSIKLIIKK
jgi:succinate-acetate transporter protein